MCSDAVSQMMQTDVGIQLCSFEDAFEESPVRAPCILLPYLLNAKAFASSAVVRWLICVERL